MIGLFALTATSTAARANPRHTPALNPELAAFSGAGATAEAFGIIGAAARSVMPGEAGIIVLRPDGKVFATVSHATVRQWNTATGHRAGRPLDGLTGPVHSIGYSPDGKMLAVAGDGEVSLWDPATGQPAGTPLTGHVGPVRSVAFSPTGLLVATAGDDGTVRLWDPATGLLVRTLTGHPGAVRMVVFSPDGARLASVGDGADNTVRLWADRDRGADRQPADRGPRSGVCDELHPGRQPAGHLRRWRRRPAVEPGHR